MLFSSGRKAFNNNTTQYTLVVTSNIVSYFEALPVAVIIMTRITFYIKYFICKSSTLSLFKINLTPFVSDSVA